MNNDICVVCGKVIPEGTMVCLTCLHEHNIDTLKEHYTEEENEVGGAICRREMITTESTGLSKP